jgi:phenylacetic acid degradation operon negative regulatory protein
MIKEKSKLKKEVFKISEGILASLTDLTLVFVNFGCALLTDPAFGRSLPHTLSEMDKRMEKINYASIKRAIIYARQKGWIKGDLEISKEGRERLENIFPEYSSPVKWKGDWYLVNFDIPKKLNRKRDILRENLKILGFGKLQDSIWISPYNFLGNVEKIVKEYFLTPYVIFSVSNQVGRIESKNLAEKIWGLSKVNELYQRFLFKFENKKNVSSFEVFFQYHNISSQDPCLPKELLPENWKGEDAYGLYSRITKNFSKNLLRSVS